MCCFRILTIGFGLLSGFLRSLYASVATAVVDPTAVVDILCNIVVHSDAALGNKMGHAG